MFNKHSIHEKFRYKTNDFNFRLGFLEETTVNRQVIFTRIDHWKNALVRYCGLSAGQSLMIHMNQISLDVFAIYFAAIECDINLVDVDPDLIIHNHADTELDTLQFNKVRNYNYFDLADLKFTGNLEYEQQGTGRVYGYSNADLESHVTTVAKTLNISGNVLHTKLKNKRIVTDFFLPSLTKQVECHLALGYNDMDLGIDKIAHIVQKCAIDCISLPSIQAVDTLRYCCERRAVDIENLKMFFFDENSVVQTNKISNIQFEDVYAKVPQMFNIDGKILKDNEELYFKFDVAIDDAVAKVKVNTMNTYLQKKFGKKITKWGTLDELYDLEDSLIIFRNL